MFKLGENKKKHGDILGGGKQLNDEIKTINNSSSNDDTNKYKGKSPKNAIEKDKKSIWSWQKFKSLIGNQKFKICFTLQVHCVEGLPSFFDDLRISVHWKRKDEEFATRPSNVIDGVAEFDDYLMHYCSIYGSKSGSHNAAKYEPKHFLLFISVYGNGEVDLGKHRIDLTRILPLTLDELEEENKSGNWATSFRLSGLAKGAIMKVSFGYVVVGKSTPSTSSSVTNVCDASISRQNSDTTLKYVRDHGKSSEENRIRRARSHPVRSSFSGLSMENIKDLHEILPTSTSESSESKNISLDNKLENDVDHKLNESSKLASLTSSYDKDGYELDDFSIIDKGIETSSKESIGSKNDITVVEPLGIEMDCRKSHQDEVLVTEQSSKTKETSKELLMKDLELTLDCASDLTKNTMDFQKDEYSNEEDLPESPRERLLREFEEGDLDHFCSMINFDMESSGEEFSDGASFSSVWETVSGDLFNKSMIEMYPFRSKSSVSELERLETEALMREWGVNKEDFQDSPCRSISGFGSPIDLPAESSHYELPELGEGLGSFIQTKDGGFLRSMNPSLFRNAKSGGKLVMQVSAPVVVPAEMGSSIMDILQHLASIGIEKLSIQANKLMPLEDITGKAMQQIAYEGSLGVNRHQRRDLLQQEDEVENRSSSEGNEDTEPNQSINIEHISLENLAPLAMEKIESLFLEGLRIQSSMSDYNALTDIIARSTSGFSALEGKKINVDDRIDLEGISGLNLLDIKKNDHDDDDDDGLMGLSLPLDEWMKLDAGKFDDENNISERTYKILAAHHANCLKESNNAKSQGEGGKCGLLRNNFTIALMVQLRDPIRDYEHVGTPMLSLIQTERVFSPLKHRIFNLNSQGRNTHEDEGEDEDEDEEEETITQYKISEVHVAGFVTGPTKKKQWGSSNQQRSGSRWLLANGMGKKNKHPLMKSNFVSNSISCSSISTLKTTSVQPSDTLWSISSSILGTGDERKENHVMNPHTRNPNIIFPKRTFWLW